MKGLVATMLTLAVVLVGSARQAGAVQVLYTFEPFDTGTTATDRLTIDGAQNASFMGRSSVDPIAANAAFGVQSASLAPFTTPTVATAIDAVGTKSLGLGTQFTLAAMIKPYNLGYGKDPSMHLFSTYNGSSLTAGEILIDIGYWTPGGSMRFLVGQTPQPNIGLSVAPPANFNDGNYHHIAYTYDNGDLAIWVDGNLLGSSANTAGAVTLDYDLRFGLSCGVLATGNYYLGDNFVGNVDDILVWDSVLSPWVIKSLYLSGAIATIPEPSSFVMLALGAMTLVGRGWRKRRRE